MTFVLKTLVAGIVISLASWLAGRRPVLAGFIVALPLVSMLSILFAYLEHRDMQKINAFAVSIFTAVPLSLIFFVPFLLHRWLKWGFVPTYLTAFACLALAYCLHGTVTGLLLKGRP